MFMDRKASKKTKKINKVENSANIGVRKFKGGTKEFLRNKNGSFSKKRSSSALGGSKEFPKNKMFKSNNHSFFNEEEDPNMKEAGDFSKFRISKEATKQLQAKGINYLFPIQSQTFDYIYDGHDLIGQARTGTGKTLSFALPLVEKLKLEIPSSKRGRAPKVLVLAPTRELAKQVSSEFENLNSELAIHCMYGGVSYGPQVMAIKAGLDVVVGTPGRILDHMVNGTLDLSQLRHVVIDEVDRMLDMGFAQSVEDIIAESYSGAGNEKPQTLLFSATLPPWVVRTAKKYMSDDRKIVDLIGDQHLKASETVQHLAIKCPYEARSSAINDVIQVYCGSHSRALIFTETKNDANTLALNSVLKQEAQVLHGDIPQEQREITLKSFRDGKLRCLVATDVAARGLDIPEVDLVVQCEPPKDLDTYIHRSGRTGRAGREGISIIFYKQSQEQQLHAVAKRAGVAFKFVKAPKAADVLKSSAEDATRFIEAVSPEVLDKFREAAESLVDKYGAVDAVAAALAHISGITDIKPRSLISGLEGFSTYLMKASVELHGPGYIWRALENNVPEIKEKVQLMKFCQDRMSVVFDVPDEFVEELEEVWGGGRGGITLEKIDELPDLIEKPRYGQVSRQSFRGGRYGARAGGYGGKESFRKDFRSVRNNMGSYEEPSFRGRQPSHAQRFNDWMNESHSSVG